MKKDKPTVKQKAFAKKPSSKSPLKNTRGIKEKKAKSEKKAASFSKSARFAELARQAREAELADIAPKKPLAKMSEVNRRENTSATVLTAALIVAVLAVNVLIFAIISVTGFYPPIVREGDITKLSGASDELFEDAIKSGKKVRITFFYSFSKETDVIEHSVGSYVNRSVQHFKKRYPGFIEVDYVNLVTRHSELEGRNVSIEKYQSTDMPLARYSVAFECGNKVKVVTDMRSSIGYSDFYTLDSNGNATSYDGEQYISAMICHVLREKPLKAYFVKGHGELVDEAFGRLLTLAGYEYDMNGYDISKGIEVEDPNNPGETVVKKGIPEDCDLLVIYNPLHDFETGHVGSEISRLNDYINRGGNLMVMLDPITKKKLDVLEGFLSGHGISVSRTKLDDGREVCDIVRENGKAYDSTGFSFKAVVTDGAIKDKIDRSPEVAVSYAGALNTFGNAQAVLKSSQTAHCEAEGKKTLGGGDFTIAAVSKTPATHPEKKNDVSTVFVMSGVYSTSPEFLTAKDYHNRDFYYAVLENYFGAQMLPYGMEMELMDSVIEGLTMGRANLYFALAMLVPASLAVVGAVIVIRRKYR